MIVVAVVPFGALAEDGGDGQRAGRWARQIARRLVDRFAGDPVFEVKPVFLVAMPERSVEAGYLVFGSTPDAALASEYARSLGASHAVSGTYRESGTGRRLEAMLVPADGPVAVARFDREIASGELHLVEPALALWLASSVGASTDRDLATPVAANEAAYAALLEAMDAEVDAALLRDSDAHGAWSALVRAANEYATAVRADPLSELIEERILVLAATAMETDLQRLILPALDALSEARPASWRAHYMLAEVRRTSGDATGAIVSFEHADALHQLRPADLLTLAQLHLAAGADAVATSRLRRIVRGAEDAATTATARRLLLRLRHPELERQLEDAGRIAVDADLARAAEADAAFDRVLAADPDIWEAHFGRGLLAWQLGDEERAQASFHRAVDLNPAASELLAELGAKPVS